MSTAAASLVSRNWGERKYDAARKYAGQSISISLAFSGLLVLAAWPFTFKMIHFMGGSEDVVAVGGEYLRIILLSFFFGMTMLQANGIIRALGDTTTPMLITLTVNIVNIIVSIVLAFGLGPFPEMGFYGVAWGTAVARTLGGILSISALVIKKNLLHLPIHWLCYWKSRVFMSLLDLAYPSMFERLLTNGAHIIFMRIVALLGTTALAAHNIALHVESLAFMPGMGISVAVSTIVGQAIGAGRQHIAEKTVIRSLIWSGTGMGILGLLFVAFARQGVVIFGATPEVLRLAGIALQISALEHPFLAFTMILAGSLRGAGDTRSPFYVMLFCVFFLRFGAVYFLAITMDMGLAGVWIGTAIDWAGRTIGLWLVFRRGVWKLIHEKQKLKEAAEDYAG
jgi:putative MATE family efflux protein